MHKLVCMCKPSLAVRGLTHVIRTVLQMLTSTSKFMSFLVMIQSRPSSVIFSVDRRVDQNHSTVTTSGAAFFFFSDPPTSVRALPVHPAPISGYVGCAFPVTGCESTAHSKEGSWRADISTDKVRTDGRTNGLTDKRTDERTNGRTDGQILLCPKFYLGA